jgi:ribosomal protein S18 acetylase RimI-like enzyme
MGAFSSRVACSDDETKIWDVLVEVAPDIPARVEDPKDQENLKALISKWVHNGNSWVALDSDSLVIGFILTEPAMAIRLQEKNKALYMPYIGVSKKWQGRGVFPQLLNELKSQGEPLTVSVLHTNKRNMVAKLEKAGFAKDSRQEPKQTYLRWNPPNATQAHKA